MKAIVIRRFGGPDVLRLEDVSTPEPGPDDVVVQVEAVTVNRTLDLAVRAGLYARPVRLPHVLGADPVGTVARVGAAVENRTRGDRVVVAPRLKPATATEPPVVLGVQVWGGYAEYVCVPARATHRIPDGLDFPKAAVIARHAPLAFNLLRDKARLCAGESVLVMGASGGLGSAGIQVAKYLNARVIAGAGSEQRVAAARRLGADAGIDYRQDDLRARVLELTDGRGVDVVFENVGDPDLFPKAFAALGRNGRLVTAGAHGGGKVPLDVNHLYLNAITVVGSTFYADADMEQSLKAAAEGRLDAMIDCVLPLSEAAAAHRRIAERGGIGKVVLRPTLS